MATSIDQIGSFIGRIAAHKQWRFQLGDEEITGEQMGDPACILPMILLNVEQIYQKCFDREMGVRLEAAEDAYLGVRVTSVSENVPVSEVTVCCVHALREMVAHCHPEMVAEVESEQEASAVPPIQIEDFVGRFLRDVSSPSYNIALPARVLALMDDSPAPGAASATVTA